MRTIQAIEVEGMDYIFQFPNVGDGHYIIRCDQGPSIYHFKQNPLKGRRAIRHFNQTRPRSKCHERRHGEQGYKADEEIVRTFGYRGKTTWLAQPMFSWLDKSRVWLS
jgi:hypothetical protein